MEKTYNTFDDVLKEAEKTFKDIDADIFKDRHGVIGKTVSPEIEKQVFGFSVSDVNFK